MGHLPYLIQDLALILMAGAITTLLFRKIKQPLVLGYIIAGFLVGPHMDYLPTITDSENVSTLAEIGVIFLLFSLGLEFSFRKLARVGGTASITAMVEIIFITSGGYFVGRILGWSTMDSIFLGGMLASSSTTIIIRAFDELGVKTKQFAKVVFGVLIVEDIVVILLMVLLSTVAVTRQFEGEEILLTVLKLAFFLALWFITGIYLLPTILKRVRNLLNEETLLILTLGLCLGMVVLATKVGFSAELGAFIMGSIIAETTLAERVENLIKPVKDLFGAIFFVSIGAMIDPQAIADNAWAVVCVTFLTLFGKLFSTILGGLLSGQPLKQSVQVGMSMAQIGEFAFIVATLGLSLGVISEFLFPVAVGASAITTFTTPYMIRYSGRFYEFISKILPTRWVSALEGYSRGAQEIRSESALKKVLKQYATIVVVNGIIVLSIMLICVNLLLPFLEESVEEEWISSALMLVISLSIAFPFIWALIAKKPDSMDYRELWLDKRYNHGPLLVIEYARVAAGLTIITIWINWVVPGILALVVLVPIVAVILYIFSSRLQKVYRRIEGRFMMNLKARESIEKQIEFDISLSDKNRSFETELGPWDAYITQHEVKPHAIYVGKTLMELGWRESHGINIAYIKRGDKLIHAPGRHNKLMPFDKVGVIATEEQMKGFSPVFFAEEPIEPGIASLEDIVLQKIRVDEYTRLKGQTIRGSGVRERTNGLVVGIERQGRRILNPDSNTVFEWDDIVWIVGERKKLQKLISGGST